MNKTTKTKSKIKTVNVWTSKTEGITCALRDVATSKEYSFEALSVDTNININQLYRYSCDQNIPSIKNALTIAKALEVDVNEIWKLK